LFRFAIVDRRVSDVVGYHTHCSRDWGYNIGQKDLRDFSEGFRDVPRGMPPVLANFFNSSTHDKAKKEIRAARGIELPWLAKE
jgi:hypothetical protein